jgi:hypothetical protein
VASHSPLYLLSRDGCGLAQRLKAETQLRPTTGRGTKRPSTLNDIQGGNFNWNKIHNFETSNFCKKYRNSTIFIFPCPHFDAYGFCISAPGSAQPPPTFWCARKFKPKEGKLDDM